MANSGSGSGSSSGPGVMPAFRYAGEKQHYFVNHNMNMEPFHTNLSYISGNSAKTHRSSHRFDPSYRPVNNTTVRNLAAIRNRNTRREANNTHRTNRPTVNIPANKPNSQIRMTGRGRGRDRDRGRRQRTTRRRRM